MTGGGWTTPAQVDGRQQDLGAATEQLLRAVTGAVGLPTTGPEDRGPAGTGVLTVDRQRLAGRSDISVLSAAVPGGARRRWVVKQPHTGWSQDDVANPLSAQQEHEALRRLHEHFTGLGLPFGVPEPVAFLPEVDAVVMEHVDGVTVKDLLHYGSLRHPGTLLDGLAASGTFLRHLHAMETLPDVEVDLAERAERVLEVAEEKLHPLGLDLPARVRRTLTAIPRTRVGARQVRLHGDFGPANILLARDGSTVGLDPTLEVVGFPEEDLVRYVALTSGVIRLAPELVLPPLAAVRRRMEDRLLSAYYQGPDRPPLYELTYLHQLCRRWCRMRELAAQSESPRRLGVKLRVIGAQARSLMDESARRLSRGLGA